ncbi:hypothetical protein J6590_040899 [Homalodisca vitripennis]|nr:hypothetical protein J6590_040899 [Homalodisca vitripennis]
MAMAIAAAVTLSRGVTARYLNYIPAMAMALAAAVTVSCNLNASSVSEISVSSVCT